MIRNGDNVKHIVRDWKHYGMMVNINYDFNLQIGILLIQHT